MAFEQTQKTRVESKQFSGDWAQFAAPSGSTGNATEPYVSPSQGLDLSPLARGIDSVVDTFERNNKTSGRGSNDGDTGEFINRAYDIVELNTDANGVLSARGSEAIRNLRRQMSYAGYTDNKIQSVLSAVGQDYESTRQGMLQKESRKHDIDQEKLFAKKAVELHPELTGATLKEQADVGRRYYQKMNTLGTTLRVAADTSAPKTVHDEALKSSADILITTINPDVLKNLFQEGTELNAQDELDATNEITKSIMSSGLVTDVREARSLAMEVSASFIGRARQYRTDMEKLTKDEQDRYLDLMTNQARMELQNSNPTLFTKLSLTNWDLTKWPEDKLGMLQNFDANKFGGGKATRYWQGGFDAYTANIGVQQGDPNVADASQREILDESLRRGDVGSANQALQSLMNPNLSDVLNKPQMEEQRDAAVNGYKQKIAGAMVNELRPHVQSTTGFMPGQNKVIDVGFWDTASKITPIMDKWKEGMRHIGMTDQEIVETGENALSALGVAIPDNTTNPEAFYQESARNIQQWILQHPIKSKIPFADKATPASVRVSGAMSDYMKGEISKEEALAQMSAAMNEVNQDLAAEEYNNGIEVEQEGVDLSELQQQAMNSPEFKQAMNAIAQDNTLDPEQKSEMAQNTFTRILNELLGIKTAHANVVPDNIVNSKKIEDKVYMVDDANRIKGAMKHEQPVDDLLDEKIVDRFAHNSDKYFMAKYIVDKEGFKESKYKLPGETKDTIAIGHQIWDKQDENLLDKDGKISRENAVTLLEKDIDDRETVVKKAIGEKQYKILPVEIKTGIMDAAFQYAANQFPQKFPKLISLLKQYRGLSDVSLIKKIAKELHSTTKSKRTNLKSRNDHRDALILSLI